MYHKICCVRFVFTKSHCIDEMSIYLTKYRLWKKGIYILGLGGIPDYLKRCER